MRTTQLRKSKKSQQRAEGIGVFALWNLLALLALPALGFSSSSSSRALTRADAVPSHDSLTLAFPGVKGPIPYEKYGQWEGLGTPRYRYVITDRPGLARVAS